MSGLFEFTITSTGKKAAFHAEAVETVYWNTDDEEPHTAIRTRSGDEYDVKESYEEVVGTFGEWLGGGAIHYRRRRKDDTR